MALTPTSTMPRCSRIGSPASRVTAGMPARISQRAVIPCCHVNAVPGCPNISTKSATRGCSGLRATAECWCGKGAGMRSTSILQCFTTSSKKALAIGTRHCRWDYQESSDSRSRRSGKYRELRLKTQQIDDGYADDHAMQFLWVQVVHHPPHHFYPVQFVAVNRRSQAQCRSIAAPLTTSTGVSTAMPLKCARRLPYQSRGGGRGFRHRAAAGWC